MADRRRDIDWAAVEARYIAGRETYRELADALDCAERTIERRGSAGDWEAKRRAFVGRVSAELSGAAAEAAIARAVDEAIMSREEVLRRLTSIARGGMRRVAEWGPGGVVLRDSSALSEDDQALVSEVGETVNQHGKAVRIKVLDPLSALKELARHHGIAVDGKGGVDAGSAAPAPAADEARRALGTAELNDRIAAALERARGGRA